MNGSRPIVHPLNWPAEPGSDAVAGCIVATVRPYRPSRRSNPFQWDVEDPLTDELGPVKSGPPIDPCIHPSIQPAIHPSLHPSIHPSFEPATHSGLPGSRRWPGGRRESRNTCTAASHRRSSQVKGVGTSLFLANCDRRKPALRS